MVNLKKYFKAVVSSALALSMALAAVPITASASDTITFLEGDVNDDGYVTVSDVALIAKYLNGKSGASSEEITRMDAVQNKVIEMQDYNKILLFVYKGDDPSTPEKPDLPKTVTSEVYTNIDNTTRTYLKHDCSSTSSTSYESYTLYAPANVSVTTYSLRGLSNEYKDCENLNTVQIKMNGAVASGFIVDDHVIATAAHCIYGKETNEFANNVTVNIYNAAATEKTHTYNATELHIPILYKTSANGYEDNYDYALIYVEEDLSEHGIWSLGYITDEFEMTGSELISSGFTDCDYNLYYSRYYSPGKIIDYLQSEQPHNIKGLRLTTNANTYLGKSGGPVYYETTYNGETVKSVVGVLTGGGDEFTWACRITPTLARFYLDNSEL